MKVYKVIKRIEEFEVDEKELLNRIKECDCKNDEDIQNAENISELIESFGSLYDFDNAVEDFYGKDKVKVKCNHLGYYANYDEAYSDYDYGIH
jgi:hypothetical protein